MESEKKIIRIEEYLQTGDKVSHIGKHWVSAVDNNTWAPGVYGWEEET